MNIHSNRMPDRHLPMRFIKNAFKHIFDFNSLEYIKI